MQTDPDGTFFLTALLIGALVGGAVGFGIGVYADYKDDGQIFNGSVSWKEYALFTITGGAIGALAGIAIPSIGSFIGSSLPSISTMLLSGGQAATLCTAGIQILSGTTVVGLGLYLFSKNADRYGRSKIGSNQMYNKMFDDFCNSKNIKDKSLRRRFHDYITKKGYNTWKNLEEAWARFIGR